MTDTPKLLPCPFCGKADIRPFDNSVVCNSCSATGPDLGHCVGPECRAEAIAAWNLRHDAAVSAARKEGMRAKALEWERGIVDWALPLPGMRYVACSTTPHGCWAWWLDKAEALRTVETSEEAAKAAAQTDYEARILSALETTP